MFFCRTCLIVNHCLESLEHSCFRWKLNDNIQRWGGLFSPEEMWISQFVSDSVIFFSVEAESFLKSCVAYSHRR